jgi:hypothetical protein
MDEAWMSYEGLPLEAFRREAIKAGVVAGGDERDPERELLQRAAS